MISFISKSFLLLPLLQVDFETLLNEFGVAITAIVAGIVTVSVNINKVLYIFKSWSVTRNLINGLSLINGHRGELNANVKEALKNTDWVSEDLVTFGNYAGSASYNIPRPYSESLLKIITAIILSLRELYDNSEINNEGIRLLSVALTDFTAIYRYMPEEHFRSVVDIIVTLM